MFSMFAEQVPPQKGPHKPQNVGQQRDISWPGGHIYGLLRQLKVHSVQHDIPWLYRASEFRNPYLESELRTR